MRLGGVGGMEGGRGLATRFEWGLGALGWFGWGLGRIGMRIGPGRGGGLRWI